MKLLVVALAEISSMSVDGLRIMGFFKCDHPNQLMKTITASIITVGLFVVFQSYSATINFDLTGIAGNGLLAGNQPGSVAGGSGGEIGAGITYDTVTSNLTVHVAWGSTYGFTDLSSAANNSHIHGPTPANYGDGYTQTAGVAIGLTRTSDLATGGTISNSFTLNATQVSDLLNGKYYINIHTVTNGGGEIRGFLVPLPTLSLTFSSEDLVEFDLTGVAGAGMLTGNQPGVVSGGSGGEIGEGIVLDTTTSNLMVNVGWGSSFGFTDLTSDVNNSHIHGPTASNFGNGFTETAGVLFNLTRTSNLASGGTISNSFTLNSTQLDYLYNGRLYINIHTATNGGGEIRGFLVPVPQATLIVSGVTGQKQIIQYSDGLPTWTSVATNSTGTTPFIFAEDYPLLNAQRYYRAIVLP